MLVHTQTSGEPGGLHGITTFILDQGHPGMTVEKVMRPMGATMEGRQSILSFDDCSISEEQVLGEVDEGFTKLINWIGMGRLTIPAMSIGRAQCMLDATVDYAKQRLC